MEDIVSWVCEDKNTIVLVTIEFLHKELRRNYMIKGVGERTFGKAKFSAHRRRKDSVYKSSCVAHRSW